MKTKTILLIILLSVGYLLCFFQLGFSATATATQSYDELNRLVQTFYDTGYKVTTISYSYDSAGNMIQVTIFSDQLLGDVDDSGVVDLTKAVIC